MKKHFLLFLVPTLLILSCNSDDDSVTSTDVITTPPSTNPSPTPNPALSAMARTTLEIVNRYRTQGCVCGSETMPPVPAIRYNDILGRVAQKHSDDMFNNNFYSHIAPDGSNPGSRMRREGYNWTEAGENIANGQTTVEIVMGGWINSPTHCKNIMNPKFTEMGIGRKNNLWTQVFGKR